MCVLTMHMDELKNKALSLPLQPGVYVMKDKMGEVIYVGKAKKLKNRVSQYFQDTASHTAKTRLMVSKIYDFDVIITATEFEALVLECSQIKRHMPKYNILLKDDKGYPYLRLNMKEDYPTLSMVSRPLDDGADYYGPFGSRSVTKNIMQSVRTALKLPDCNKKFPRDIGKDRPCLNYHMNLCEGWCRNVDCAKTYKDNILQLKQLLTGNYKTVVDSLYKQMTDASEMLNFELAATLRDRMAAIENLGRKQLVSAVSAADTDVVGFAVSGTKACFSVLHFNKGNLIDKEYEILSGADEEESAVSALLKQYYLGRGFGPKTILLPFDIEDRVLIAQLLEQTFQHKVTISVPVRGEKVRLIELAKKNAQEEANRASDRDDRLSASLKLLGDMLSIAPPKRIESFDISNISGTDIVAAMIVFSNGKPLKSAYKRFKINGLTDQDDYASMHQVVTRRFQDLKDCKSGFDVAPDLLLIDGGITHAAVAAEALKSLDIDIPVFGMVKDNRHRTRALVTPEGEEINIDGKPSVFSLIGSIQEETHRFAISFHRSLRSKRLQYSELDKIEGIGPKRKRDLLKKFKSLSAIKNAELPALEQVLPKTVASTVYHHFKKEREV